MLSFLFVFTPMATSKHKHMIDNMAAGYGRLPDQSMRKRMIDYMESI